MTLTKSQKARRMLARQQPQQQRRRAQVVRQRRQGPTIKRAKRARNGIVKRGTHGDLFLSLMDPWNRKGCIPDGSQNKGCFSCRQMATLATGTGGAVSCVVFPFPEAFTYVDQNSANATFTLPGGSGIAATTSYATIQNLYSRYRIVSMGIRVRFTGSDLANSGQVVVCQMPGGTAPVALNGATVGGIAALSSSFRATDTRNETVICWRPEDDEDYEFVDVGAYAANTLATQPNIPYLFFGANGLNVSTGGIIMLDIVANFEGYYRTSTLQVGESAAQAAVPIIPGWYEKTMSALQHTSQFVSDVGVSVARGAVSSLAVQPSRSPLLLGWK